MIFSTFKITPPPVEIIDENLVEDNGKYYDGDIIIPPYTGDAMTYVAIAALGVGILGLGALFIVKRRKSKKNKDNK